MFCPLQICGRMFSYSCRREYEFTLKLCISMNIMYFRHITSLGYKYGVSTFLFYIYLFFLYLFNDIIKQSADQPQTSNIV